MRWILGVLLKDKKRNEVIRKTLWWHAVLTKYESPYWDGKIMWWEERSNTEWSELWRQRRRSRGRQKKRWGDMIQQDMKSLRLKKEDTGDRKKWCGRIQVTDPSLGEINSSRKECYWSKCDAKVTFWDETWNFPIQFIVCKFSLVGCCSVW